MTVSPETKSVRIERTYPTAGEHVWRLWTTGYSSFDRITSSARVSSCPPSASAANVNAPTVTS